MKEDMPHAHMRTGAGCARTGAVHLLVAVAEAFSFQGSGSCFNLCFRKFPRELSYLLQVRYTY